ncbi:MAG: beta-ketoacyl synthase N-terminal-like domain-containing protein, partial [Anaerolineae bacterium]
MTEWATFDAEESLDIAIVGMTGRFPGARNLDEFWRNLKNGVESVSFLTDEEILAAGEDPDLLKNPHYVRARAILDDVELFDAAFFDFYPREAAVMDPQHRVFLEESWTAMESAGYNPEAYDGLTGMYAGVSMNTYLLSNLLPSPDIGKSADIFSLSVSNDRDFLPTRVSYKLNLRGPSINVQTACSTSLVAVQLACQGLLNYQCDMALAGGVSISVPQERGYLYQEGGIASPDGHCRAFDARARGTIGGNGVGIVVLKRLADALRDGDQVHAVIKGSAVNNDGSVKVGYTAPSVKGQAQVIARAQYMADVDPETISYVEAHGTGTVLGDPVEVAALTDVFRASTERTGFCAIGSVKTNFGHLDAAAGVAGLIKTVLALKHKQIPPSLHYEQPNPEIDFEHSPFYVNATLSEWTPPYGAPRRAGVSSFGIGGTNAHVVLEEAPDLPPSGPSRPWQLLLVSAKTPSALQQATSNLAAHLKEQGDVNLADVAFTSQVGRRAFDHRRVVVCRDQEDALAALEARGHEQVFTGFVEAAEPPLVFMFTGQGAQYANMGRGLHQHEEVFREELDRCHGILAPILNLDLRDLIYPAKGDVDAANERLRQTMYSQPALFAIEYALAKLWMSWGVRPDAMIGHSIGEYTAACLAGVFSLEDALGLVATRGRMMQSMPPGAMLSLPLPEKDVLPWLEGQLSLAVINAPSLCVVSGPEDDVESLEHRLAEQGVDCRRLHTSHAFHSPMMEPILDAFTARVAETERHHPQMPFVSNVTGTWIKAEEATDPRYWASHLRQAVRFADGISTLLEDLSPIMLEVGPGRTLSTLASICARDTTPAGSTGLVTLTSVRHPRDKQPDEEFLLTTLGRLWLAGAEVDWSGFYARERRRRASLPTYPFERQRYWIEPRGQAPLALWGRQTITKRPGIDRWFYAPSWRRVDLPICSIQPVPADQDEPWLLFTENAGLSDQVTRRLMRGGYPVVTVAAGDRFERFNGSAYAVNPRKPDDYEALIYDLSTRNKLPARIVHMWSVGSCGVSVDEAQDLGFYSLLFLVQALGRRRTGDSLEIDVVLADVQDVLGNEALCPARATSLGLCRVIPQEYANVLCRSVDVSVPEPGTAQEERVASQLVAEFTADPSDVTVAYRGRHRWVQSFEPAHWDGACEVPTRLREEG